MTAGQQRALEQGWPAYGLESKEGGIQPEIVFGNSAPVTLEIGFGMGDSLVQQARENADRNFIGIEVHRPGVGHALMLVLEHGLNNFRVYSEDSISVLKSAIPARSLDRIQLFFPDPWPKKRHHKRRIVNLDFVQLAASRLQAGGLLHVATDWVPYAEEIEVLLASMDEFEALPPPARPETKFEKRGIRHGHEIRDLAWRLRSAADH